MPKLAFNVLLMEEDDGNWSALCVELEGCVSQGSSEQEAIANIVDAIQLNLDWLRSEGKSIPSAKLDLLPQGALVFPDYVPEAKLKGYPGLDPRILLSARRKTLLVS